MNQPIAHRCSGGVLCVLGVLLLVAVIATHTAAQSAEDRYPIVKDGKLGFIDANGIEVIPPQFFPIADMAHFQDGLAAVGGPRGSGYIDPSGRYLIGPQNEWGQGRPFHEGITGVLMWGRNGTSNSVALIDQRGQVVLSSPMLREGDYFSDGLMTMAERGKWGFVDKRFQWAIAPQYSNARAFSEGRAAVQIGSMWGFIDKTGKTVVPATYDWTWNFADGLALVRIRVAARGNERPASDCQCVLGFVDDAGQEVIRPRYSQATSFSQDRAIARAPGESQVIIDKTGNVIQLVQGDAANAFSEGLAAVHVDGLWGYVDRFGLWIIPPQFTNADDFRHGLARVAWAGGHGYINKTGRTVWKAP